MKKVIALMIVVCAYIVVEELFSLILRYSLYLQIFGRGTMQSRYARSSYGVCEVRAIRVGPGCPG